MNILDRIILTIYMLSMAVISVFVVIIPFKLISLNDINFVVSELYYNWYYTLIGLLLLALSLKLLFSGIKTDKRTRMGIIKPAEYGDIRISVDTFESLAFRSVRQIPGIRDVKVRVDIDNGELLINAKLLVLPDNNIPKIVSDVQNKIKNHIEATTEINVRKVDVTVENLSLSAARVE